MTKALRNIFLLGCFAALAACGGGGGGGDDTSANNTNPNPNPTPTTTNVAFASLAGQWFGTFDDEVGGLRQISVTISDPTDTGAKLALNKVGNDSSDLAGTISRDSAQVFRFDINNPGGTVPNKGALLSDPTGKYLVWLSSNGFQFGVLEKGAQEPLKSDRAQENINASWGGTTVTTGAIAGGVFPAITPESSSASCQPEAAGSPSGPSTCAVTRGTANATASAVTLADPLGRWRGDYPPQNAGGANRTFQAYASQDKNFIGTFACGNSYPETCEFTGWTKK